MSDLKELPEGWTWVKLGSVVEINPKLPNKESIRDDTEVQFIPMKLIEELIGKIHLTEVRRYNDVKKGYTAFTNNDILFAKVTPCMENGKVAIASKLRNNIGFGSTEFHVLRPSKNINSSFLFYFLIQNSFRAKAANAMTGAVGLRRVPKQFIEEFYIPLPPYELQKLILKRLDELFSELDKAIANFRSAKQQLQTYRQSVLKWAFEGKLINNLKNTRKIPETWHLKRLSEIGRWSGGGTPSKSNKSFWQKGSYLWVSPKDMKSKFVNDTIDKITIDAINNSSTKLIKKGSILLVVRSGILRRILPVALTNCDVTINQDLQAITPTDMSANFIYWYLIYKNEDIRKQCSKDGTTVESIESSKLKNYLIPVPSINEQNEVIKEIENRLSIVENLEYSINNCLNKSESLKQSILKNAFEGKLV